MKPEYERYVKIQYGWSLSGNWPEAAMVRALAQQMVYEDPVVYDWAHIKVPPMELGGEKDGANFPQLAEHVCDTIPKCELVLLPTLCHVRHLPASDVVYTALM